MSGMIDKFEIIIIFYGNADQNVRDIAHLFSAKSREPFSPPCQRGIEDYTGSSFGLNLYKIDRISSV